MADTRTTRRLLTAYADEEQWKRDHVEAQTCLNVEETLAWGVHLFRGLLDLESRAQFHAFNDPVRCVEELLEAMPEFYKSWLSSSERHLATAMKFQAKGYTVEGFDEFRACVEEARCLLGNLDLEDQIRPFEELASMARPENPRPERYVS